MLRNMGPMPYLRPSISVGTPSCKFLNGTIWSHGRAVWRARFKVDREANGLPLRSLAEESERDEKKKKKKKRRAGFCWRWPLMRDEVVGMGGLRSVNNLIYKEGGREVRKSSSAELEESSNSEKNASLPPDSTR
ncbi:hypothetical protein V6N13_075315 [Hibiscus sabdariffa]|uniref:Uncharacterized protein n=1 Tax=Hibiscus sabdariffa TaxID=183260 RepID=A0ABR2UBI0_9ROSI